jgi:hypothetical protein
MSLQFTQVRICPITTAAAIIASSINGGMRPMSSPCGVELESQPTAHCRTVDCGLWVDLPRVDVCGDCGLEFPAESYHVCCGKPMVTIAHGRCGLVNPGNR